MNPGDRLLSHFDRIVGKPPLFREVSDRDVSPVMNVAVYSGFPERETLTAFTVGLSLFHPPGGAHKELMISMRDSDDVWALACGYTAYQLRERCAFAYGDTIDFGDRISPQSQMTSFITLHPIYISPSDSVLDIGVRQVEIVQLVPIYDSERILLADGGDIAAFLNAFPRHELMDPLRRSFE